MKGATQHSTGGTAPTVVQGVAVIVVSYNVQRALRGVSYIVVSYIVCGAVGVVTYIVVSSIVAEVVRKEAARGATP